MIGGIVEMVVIRTLFERTKKKIIMRGSHRNTEKFSFELTDQTRFFIH